MRLFLKQQFIKFSKFFCEYFVNTLWKTLSSNQWNVCLKEYPYTYANTSLNEFFTFSFHWNVTHVLVWLKKKIDNKQIEFCRVRIAQVHLHFAQRKEYFSLSFFYMHISCMQVYISMFDTIMVTVGLVFASLYFFCFFFFCFVLFSFQINLMGFLAPAQSHFSSINFAIQLHIVTHNNALIS